MLFLCFGVAGVIGNLIGTRMMDLVGPVRVGVVAMSCILLALSLWPLTYGSLTVSIVLTVVWGLGFFAVNGSQQVRLVAMAPSLASASVAVNSSAFYLGQGGGAFLGGLVITTLGPESLSFFGAAPMALAIVVSLYAASLLRRKAELAA